MIDKIIKVISENSPFSELELKSLHDKILSIDELIYVCDFAMAFGYSNLDIANKEMRKKMAEYLYNLEQSTRRTRR